MKKLFAFLLVFALMLTCFACGKTPDKQEKPTYSVQITNNKEQGSVAGVNAFVVYKEGTTLNITVTAKDGFKIKSITWNEENQTITNEHVVSFSQTVSSNCSLVVVYEAGFYQATIVNDNDQGEIDGIIHQQSYSQGTVLQITVTPKYGFAIATVVWNNIPVQITNPNGFTFQRVVDGTSTLSVLYTETLVTATVNNDSQKGTVTGFVNGEKYSIDNYVTITVTPNEGYTIKSIIFNGIGVPVDENQKVNGISFQKMLSKNSTLTVEYDQKTYTATASYSSALVTVTGIVYDQKYYAYGTQLDFTVTVLDQATTITSITVNGQAINVTDTSTMTVSVTVLGDVNIVILCEGWSENV